MYFLQKICTFFMMAWCELLLKSVFCFRKFFFLIVGSSWSCKIAWYLSLFIMPCTVANRPVGLAPKLPQDICGFFTWWRWTFFSRISHNPVLFVKCAHFLKKVNWQFETDLEFLWHLYQRKPLGYDQTDGLILQKTVNRQPK